MICLFVFENAAGRARRDGEKGVEAERRERFGEAGLDIGEFSHLRDGGPQPHRRAEAIEQARGLADVDAVPFEQRADRREDPVEVAGVVARRERDRRRQTAEGERPREAELEAHRVAALGTPDDDVHDLRRPLGELRHRGEDRRVARGEEGGGGVGFGHGL